MKQEIKKALLHQLSKQESNSLKQAIMEDVKYIEALPKEEKVSKSYNNLFMRLALCAVAIFSFITFNIRPSAIVSIDVNPAIELKVNHKDRVIDVITHNEEAKIVVGDMELKNVDIEVVVHAITGKMFQLGYLNNIKNSMLLTVQSDDVEYRTYLKDMLSRDIETSYQIYETPISLLIQELDYHTDLARIAKQYNISEGKASLIMELVNANPEYQIQDFINLSIQDIQTLVHYNQLTYQSISAKGSESHDGYINEQELIDILQKHANVVVDNFEYQIECHNNRLVYFAKFNDDLARYNYEVNAISGEIISYSLDLKNE